MGYTPRLKVGFGRSWRSFFVYSAFWSWCHPTKHNFPCVGKMGAWVRRWQFSRSDRILFWVTSLICAVLIFMVMSIYKFLAVTRPLGDGILVVDAWIPARTLAESVSVFNSGRYRYLVVLGGPTQEIGKASHSPVADADLAANTLEKLGLDTRTLVRIRVPDDSSGRTLRRAAAFRNWLDSSQASACSVDVFTAGVHARKSWILFRHALGSRYRVGIVAGNEFRYPPRFWFISRTGIRIVSRNLAGYLYSKLWIAFNDEASGPLKRTVGSVLSHKP